MARRHVIQPGECLSSVASRFGFRSARTLYDDPANASLRAARPDPNLLVPGDGVMIPDREAHLEPAGTAQRHVFFARVEPTFVRLKVERDDDFDFALEIDGVEIARGRGDGRAPIVAEIDPEARAGKLIVWPTDLTEPPTEANGFVFKLSLGRLQPVTTTAGVKARLANLSFYAGVIDDVIDEPTAEAVRRYERAHGLPPTGLITDALRALLEREHDHP